jgi:PAS domain S-box-containing protein
MLDSVSGDALIRAADAAGLGICAFVPEPPDGQWLFVNERAAGLLGYTAAELRKLRPLDTVVPAARAEAGEDLHRFLAGEATSGRLRTLLLHREGRAIRAELAYTSMNDAGRPAAVAFVSEVPDATLTSSELRRSEARFRELVELAPDGVGIIQDGHFAYANTRAATILGFESPHALCDTPLSELFEAGDYALMSERIRTMLTERRRFPPYAYTCIRRDGVRVRLEVLSSPTEHRGRPAVLGVARDVTERTRMDAQLAQVDRLHALGTLAAGVAHEINNPLTFFYLRLDALERWVGRLPEELRAHAAEQIGELRGGAERVTRIVRDLRTFSRSADQPRGPVELREVFAFVERITQSEHKHRAAFEVSVEDVPPVLGEQGRLEQVFLNLVLNALQALPDGEPDRSWVRLRARHDGDEVIVEVADNGPGMAADVAARIFDPFFTTKPVGVGTGLGLSICHGIVNQLGGSITVESSPGVGTTFQIRLPTASIGDRVDEPRRSVLVVEDDELVAGVVMNMLGERHDVVQAADGETAIRALAGRRFDVVLCDLVMPGMTGEDLYERVRTTHPEQAIRFVFMTGGVLTERTARFLDSVSAPRVLKPFSAETLARAVDEILR